MEFVKSSIPKNKLVPNLEVAKIPWKNLPPNWVLECFESGVRLVPD
jgi:hypothetical protein